MAKTIFGVITVLGVCIASLAQDTDYYKAIQRRSSTRVQPAHFKAGGPPSSPLLDY